MKRILTSAFGLGLLPAAPGTWGSLLPAIIFGLSAYLGTQPITITVIMAILAAAASFVCVKFSPAVIAATGNNDPGEIVVDEVAGQAVTYFAVAFSASAITNTSQICAFMVLGFGLFRLFDITKPWPIRRLEKFPAGWGILADDLLAGVFGAIALFLCSRLGVVSYLSGCLSFSDGDSLDMPRAVILGVIQGATEFLPVSSSGHLVLFENIFNFDPETPEMLLFDLAVHIGTLAAIFIVFRKSITAFVKNFFSFRRYGQKPVEIYKKSPSIHILVLAVIATVVTGAIGIPLEDYFESARGSLALVASMWLVTGTFLLITDRRKKTRMGLRQFGIVAAVIVGLAQAFAILPGISRSGATISAAILLGLHRRWAVEFSFLLAIPAILGATLIQSIKDFEQISSGALPIASVLAGAVAAAVTGYFALKLLIKASRGANLKYFAFYCYFLASVVFLFMIR